MSSDKPIEREFVVGSELGLHARPAGLFVSIATRYECEIDVAKDDEWVSGRSVLSILSLAAGPGTRLRIRARGPGAPEAVAELGELVESYQESKTPGPP